MATSLSTGRSRKIISITYVFVVVKFGFNQMVFKGSIIGLTFAPLMSGIFEWSNKEAEFIEKMIHAMQDVIRSNDTTSDSNYPVMTSDD